jgi:hypothetical protein
MKWKVAQKPWPASPYCSRGARCGSYRAKQLLSSEADVATPFNHAIEHRAANLRHHPYAQGTDPRSNKMAAINICCLEFRVRKIAGLTQRPGVLSHVDRHLYMRRKLAFLAWPWEHSRRMA